MTLLMACSQNKNTSEEEIPVIILSATKLEEIKMEETTAPKETTSEATVLRRTTAEATVPKETTAEATVLKETTAQATEITAAIQTSTEIAENMIQAMSAESICTNEQSYYQYVVQEGDTLWLISQINGISVEELKSYNGIFNDNIIVGMILSIPTNPTNDYDNNYYSYNNNQVCTETTNDYNNNYYGYNDNQVCMATQTLSVWCSWDSWYNIQLAMDTLNGYYLAPGASFSWARDCGANSAEEGYVDAGVYITDQYGNTISSTAPGGGVCLVSTCMMQTARSAGCIITEKHDHTLPVSYAYPGDEASVSYGSWDLQFYNPSSTTGLTFTTWYDNSSCSVTITATPT